MEKNNLQGKIKSDKIITYIDILFIYYLFFSLSRKTEPDSKCDLPSVIYQYTVQYPPKDSIVYLCCIENLVYLLNC